MYFVIWEGDLNEDPLNKGCEVFDDLEDAYQYSDRCSNKGLVTHVYTGLHVCTQGVKL